jgi:Mg-chelatase subunit ChlI
VQEVLQAALDGGHASTALLNLVLARAVEGCDDLDAAAALDFAQRGAAVVTIGDATRELMARAEAAAAPPAPVEEDEDDGAEEEDDSSSDSDSGSDSSADDSSESSDDEDGAPVPAST